MILVRPWSGNPACLQLAWLSNDRPAGDVAGDPAGDLAGDPAGDAGAMWRATRGRCGGP
jgi:hypothetical protein